MSNDTVRDEVAAALAAGLSEAERFVLALTATPRGREQLSAEKAGKLARHIEALTRKKLLVRFVPPRRRDDRRQIRPLHRLTPLGRRVRELVKEAGNG